MLTGDIRNQINAIWDAFWSSGISNPLEVMEQITYLLFLRTPRSDDSTYAHHMKDDRFTSPTPALLAKVAHAVNQSSSNQQGVEGLNISPPPVKLQLQFAHRITAVEKCKAAHKNALAELDALFVSLQHRAFRGEL